MVFKKKNFRKKKSKPMLMNETDTPEQTELMEIQETLPEIPRVPAFMVPDEPEETIELPEYKKQTTPTVDPQSRNKPKVSSRGSYACEIKKSFSKK